MSDYGYRPAPPPEDGRPRGGGPQSGRARGGAPGDAGSGQPDYGWGGQQPPQGPAPRPPRPQPHGTPASGSASVGRASGSASVGRGSASVSPGRASGSASPGRASVGRAAGSAQVGGASGAAPVGGAGRTGRASVGAASVGSASVGSASVGAAGASRPPGRADGRPGRAGATVAGRRRAGKEPLDESDLDGKAKALKKKRRRKKILAGLIAVGVLFVAGVTMVASYFFVDVGEPGDIARAGESTTFYYANGAEAGGYGETLRLQAEEDEIPDAVKDALVATEDRKFWDHSGVDVAGTMRALINNVTGGSTQGASTITQQYAGMVLDIRDEISYDRKAKEAAMAMKIESKYDKEQIITAYLNLAYFGRGATGIEAAAKVYFNKPLQDLTPAEAAYIVMQVKSPNGTYDPYYTDYYDADATQARWDYSMQAMVDEGYLKQADKDAAELPVPTDTFNSAGSWGGNTDIGFIINELDGYVFDEIEERYGIAKKDLYGGEDGKGGYSIKLTIDPEIQASLKSTGSRGDIKVKTDADGNPVDADGNPVEDISQAEKDLTDEGYAQFENDNDDAALAEYEPYMMTAMVAIDPETGAIVGYYGGDNGFGVDKAGAESPHPPSSTFKMVTAATALEQGDSINSWFNADSPRPFDSLTLDESESCIGGGDYPDCTLRNGSQDFPLELTLTDAVRKSKNTPMYSISEYYGANSILNLADEMGLSVMNQARTIEDDNGEPHDVSINYVMHDDGTYTQHGTAVDAEGEPVVDAAGNWDVYADIQVDEDCNPVVNLEGQFVQAEEATKCEIGGKNDTDPFYNHLSFGQYPTSVRDMASLYATIANDGVYNESHFVAEVKDNTGKVLEPKEGTLELDKRVLEEETARNLQWIGSEIGGETEAEKLPRDFFGKTGTWEAGGEDKDGEEYPESYNAHAWYVGAIPQLSIAAWVGNVTSESDPIADPTGDKNNVFGSNTAYPVWFTAMERILDKKDWDEEQWEGKVEDQGDKTYWDIEAAGGPREGGEFCAANPDNELCAGAQDDEAQQQCEDDGGTWDGEACEPGDDQDDDASQTPTDEPTDHTPTDDETTCEPWDFDCEGEPSTDPTEEGSTTSEDEEEDR